VALSNRRLESLAEGVVTFQAKDYRDGGKSKRIRLAGEEFLRRWLQHVLPRGFVKVRTYGLLANRQRQWKVQAFLKGKSKGAVIGDLQSDVFPPTRMQGRRGHVDNQPRPGPGAFSIHKTDQTRIDLGCSNDLPRLPEEKPAWSDDDSRPITVDFVFGTELLLCWDCNRKLLGEDLVVKLAKAQDWGVAGLFLLPSKGPDIPDACLLNPVEVQIDGSCIDLRGKWVNQELLGQQSSDFTVANALYFEHYMFQ